MKQRLVPFAVLAAAGLAACADHATPTGAARPDAPARAPAYDVAPYLPGRVIVRFAASAVPGARGAGMGDARRVAAPLGAEPVEALRLPRAFVLAVEPGRERAVAAALSAEPGVEFAEPDYMMELVPCETGGCVDPGDWFFGRKWDLHNTGAVTVGGAATETGAADADMDWLEAFHALGEDFTGTAVIAIIDTGIRETHGDLAGRVVAARNFASGYPATRVEDRDGHGTHVAGIAAASGALAMRGVAYGSGIRLINAKACERYLYPDGIVRTACATSSSSEAIVYAVDQGADVLNLSLGGSPYAVSGPALQQAALQYARAHGVLPFCATGNDGAASIAFPARFPECVAVGATDWSDARAGYSNAGPETALSAPGGSGATGWPLGLVFSLSADADDLYSYRSGTSMATPQAAGLAALLIARGARGADAVLARMMATADDLGPAGRDDVFGAGRINVCRALDAARVTVEMPGAFHRGAPGLFPVTVHGAPGFDPALLDAAALTLGTGASGARVALRGDAYRAVLVDADGDGDLDLEVKFSRPELAAAVASGATTLTLRGTVGCRRVEGSAPVRVTD